MLATLNIHSFCYYAITSLVLTLNLSVLWFYSGVVRGKSKQVINPEDSACFGVALAESEPPSVTRVLRTHANAQAAILPFLLLGLVFVLVGGAPLPTLIIFAIFTLARLLHSYVYLAGKQPARTIFFFIGQLATLALMVEIILRLITLMEVA